MITTKVTEPSATIILDRPEKCNALNRQMVSDLAIVLDDLRQSKKVRAIVIAGAGPNFCAGVDLTEWSEPAAAEAALENWYSDTQALRDLVEQMLQLPKPIIAAVDGAALGFGMSLAIAADLIVASQRATFAIPSTKLGLVSGMAAPLIVFRHGSALASRLMIGGDQLDAAEAYRLGLVQHIVAPEQVWVRANRWAQTIAEAPAESLQLSKKLLNEMIGEQVSTFLASGAAATATSLTTEVAAEGLRAFAEKRPPQFPR